MSSHATSTIAMTMRMSSSTSTARTSDVRSQPAVRPNDGSVVVTSAADPVAGRARDGEHRSDHEHDDSRSPQDRDLGNESDNEQDYPENDHCGSCLLYTSDAAD